MNLKEQLMADLKVAMRAKDIETRNALRMLQAAIKQVEIDGGSALDEAGAMAVVTKQAKQRRESIKEYEAAGRDDLAAPEKVELAIFERYLPTLMSREEVEQIASKVIADVGATGPRDTGKVMGRLMGQLKGKADGGLVNQVVSALLKSAE